MRCRTCDYRLWNIRSRKCPECGTAFLPSEYEFVPHSVRFCCPQCGTAYYGTASNGHLTPIEFDCVCCGRHVHMDEMVLLPTEGVEEEQTRVARMPWLHRGEIGVFKAWFQVVGMALVRPTQLMRLVPVGSPGGHAVGFSVLTNTVACLAGMSVFILLPLVIGAVGRAPSPFGVVMFAFALALLLVFLAVGVFLGVLVWSLVAHGLLRLTGATLAGLGRTFHAIGYSAGANAVSALPFCGMYIGWIWWVVSAILMLREGQRVSGGRAALAVLALPALGLGGMVALWATAFFVAISTGISADASMEFSEVAVVHDALLQYAGAHNGGLPGHAIELVTAGHIVAGDFLIDNSGVRASQVNVGGSRLDRFTYPPTPTQTQAVESAVRALPANTVAHRVGDFVFTYHGIDPTRNDPGLWMVVEAPLKPPPDRAWIGVGRADGTIIHFPASRLDRVPVKQNELRARCGLAPLPVLLEVTEDHPAIDNARGGGN